MSFQEQCDAVAATNAADRRISYENARKRTPPPGMGYNFHCWVFGHANRALNAGIGEDKFAADVMRDTPPGNRTVTEAEIRRAYRNATASKGASERHTSLAPARFRPEFLDAIIARGAGATMDTIRASSPVPIPEHPLEQQRLFLSRLYWPDELMFIGPKCGTTVKSVWDWLDDIEKGAAVGPFACINPLSGLAAPTKSGSFTYRGDACVTRHRYCLVEFDELDLDRQAMFWAAADLPVAAITFSGRRSLHALLRVDVADAEAWAKDVASRLFTERLGPLGADVSCRNPSRLTRLAGAGREDTGQVQTLLYLAPEGKAVRA